MITVGIDCGTQRTKAVLVRNEEIQATAITRTEFDTNKAASDVLQMLFESCDITQKDVDAIYITGIGADTIKMGDVQFPLPQT